MAIAVTIASGTALDVSNMEAVLTITFTNTAKVTYAENSNLIYTCKLTDSSTTPKEDTVMFSIHKESSGELTAGATQNFTFDNTAGLTGTITGSDAVLYYTP